MTEAVRGLKDALTPEVSGLISQIGYYVRGEMWEDMEALGEWARTIRDEMIILYPGREPATEATFDVAHSLTYVEGVDVELIEPLTEPNYISMLELLPGQVAHLGVNAKMFPGFSDEQILRRFSEQPAQMIQHGGEMGGQPYTIYQLDDFLPVKLIHG